MEETQNKTNLAAAGQIPTTSFNQADNKSNEEERWWKDTEILVRDEKGEFKYVKGESLLTPEQKKSIKQVTASEIRSPLLTLKKPSEKLTASFYFDAEDEDEIEKIHAEKIGAPTLSINFDSIVEEIKQAAAVNFSDELLQKRFLSLITSRLRDIRNSYQLRELLLRSQKVGGLELSPEKADEVVKLTEEKAKTIHDQKTIKELEERQKLKAEEEKEKEEERLRLRQAVAREQIRKMIQEREEKKAVPSEPEAPAQIAERPEIRYQPPPKKEIRKTIPVIPQVRRPLAEVARKQKIEDIKTPTRLLGPIEEIRTINLTDFRRFSHPDEAVKKIKEMIDLLEEESFTKKAEGIQAWKQSEICQLYLDIGNESMNKGKSVREIIESRTMEGRSYLTPEEFEAVGDLNKQLRF